MRYQSTGEVTHPESGQKYLTWPPNWRDEYRHVLTCSKPELLAGPRVIMEPVPTPEQLPDRAIEALVAWRPLDRLLESGEHARDWTPHVEALERLRKAADAYLEGLVNA